MPRHQGQTRNGQEDVAGRAPDVYGGHGIFLHTPQDHQGESGKVRATLKLRHTGTAAKMAYLQRAPKQHELILSFIVCLLLTQRTPLGLLADSC